MNDVDMLDMFYQKMRSDFAYAFPDGIIPVDIELLQSWDLVSVPQDEEFLSHTTSWSKLLHVIEGDDKITLYNQSFIAWIIPTARENKTLIAVARWINGYDTKSIQPEIAFSVQGIHNQSKTILKLIEKSFQEIEETEEVIDAFSHEKSE